MPCDIEVDNSSLRLVIEAQFIEKIKRKLGHENTTTKACKRLIVRMAQNFWGNFWAFSNLTCHLEDTGIGVF